MATATTDDGPGTPTTPLGKLNYFSHLRISPELSYSSQCAEHTSKDNDTFPGRPRASMPGDRPEEDAWSSLPDHLIEKIIASVRDEQGHAEQKVMFAITGVCTSWRRVGHELFFSQLWPEPSKQKQEKQQQQQQQHQQQLIRHPRQLFCLSPSPVEGGLLRCFIQRSVVSRSLLGVRWRFTLFAGSDHTAPSAQFLMLADQVSSTKFVLSTCRDGSLGHCAMLQGNMTRTGYALVSEPAPWVARLMEGCGHLFPSSSSGHQQQQRQASLMNVEYRMRMRGIMLPRRVKVELPQPLSILDNPLYSNLALLSMSPSHHPDNDVPFDLNEGLEAEQALDPDELDPGAVDNNGNGGERERLPSLDLAHLCSKPSMIQRGPPLPASQPVIKLQNKPPHWNEAMKCWCLNFRGRVRLPSVKNFQLTHSADPRGRIMMQFGKVDADLFILDFNPCVLTTLQAFSLALTSFERKYML